MHFRFFVCLLLLVQLQSLGFTHAVNAEDGAALQKVAVLTRNGARGLLTLTKGKLSCGACELSLSGKKGSFLLGEFLLSRYGAQLQLGTQLNTTRVSFHAAETARTVATGQGVTLGMYPQALPLVKYTPEEDDEVLAVTESWPSWVMQDAWRLKLHLDDAWVSERLTKDDLKILSRFLPPNSDVVCDDSPSLCALYVYDSWSVNASEGREDATLQPLLTALETVSRRFLWRLYGADPSTSDNRDMGPLAGPFLREEVISRFVPDSRSDEQKKARLSVYVGSMPIVFATFSALGVFDAENTQTDNAAHVPRFGDAIALEYKTADKAQYVQAYQLTLSSGSTTDAGGYTSKPLEMKCMDKSGAVYTSSATPGGCTVEDMQRYLNSLGATNGRCFATESMITDADCDGDGAPAGGSLCHMYRAKCLGAQCGSIHGAVADPSRGFACQDAVSQNTPYLAATIVAFGAPCVLASSLLGFYLSASIKHLLCSKRNHATG